MKNSNISILERYAKMSGDKKVRIAMDLSELVREVYNEGKTQTLTKKKITNESKTTS